MRRLAFLLCVAIIGYLSLVSARAADGKPPQWPVAAEEPSGATWEVQPGSVQRVGGRLGSEFVGTVLRRYQNASGPAANVYTAAVQVAHCARAEGVVELRTLSGEAIEAQTYRTNGFTVGAGIARHLCRIGKALP